MEPLVDAGACLAAPAFTDSFALGLVLAGFVLVFVFLATNVLRQLIRVLREYRIQGEQ